MPCIECPHPRRCVENNKKVCKMDASRFRPKYRALSEAEKALCDEIKSRAAYFEDQIEKLADGRYKSLAMTSLEESVMWAVKQVTS